MANSWCCLSADYHLLRRQIRSAFNMVFGGERWQSWFGLPQWKRPSRSGLALRLPYPNIGGWPHPRCCGSVKKGSIEINCFDLLKRCFWSSSTIMYHIYPGKLSIYSWTWVARSNFNHLLTGIRHSKSRILSRMVPLLGGILQTIPTLTAQTIQVMVSDIAPHVKFVPAPYHIVKTIDQVHAMSRLASCQFLQRIILPLRWNIYASLPSTPKKSQYLDAFSQLVSWCILVPSRAHRHFLNQIRTSESQLQASPAAATWMIGW